MIDIEARQTGNLQDATVVFDVREVKTLVLITGFYCLVMTYNLICALIGLESIKSAMLFIILAGYVTGRTVSTFSLQQGWRGQTQILEMFVIPGEEGEGVRLVVNETPYTRIGAGHACVDMTPDSVVGFLVHFAPSVASPKSFVLADQLAYCRFSYLVAPPVPTGQPQTQPPQWRSSATGSGWPRAIRVEMAPLEANPSHLQPITVTAPIRIHRSWNIHYEDF